MFVPYQLSQCEYINGLQRGVRSICVHEQDFSVIRPKTETTTMTTTMAVNPDGVQGCVESEYRGLWISLHTKVTADIEEKEHRCKQTKRPRGSVEGRREIEGQTVRENRRARIRTHTHPNTHPHPYTFTEYCLKARRKFNVSKAFAREFGHQIYSCI